MTTRRDSHRTYSFKSAQIPSHAFYEDNLIARDISFVDELRGLDADRPRTMLSSIGEGSNTANASLDGRVRRSFELRPRTSDGLIIASPARGREIHAMNEPERGSLGSGDSARGVGFEAG
ncbi:hypothetical protein ONZ51_g9864 [Trametes cubensis]|uniref:Uncharacterized protein n=1 Tax=Trametes cubensis TaxID=1111947 RepID=A0AAD7X9E7_9APHY|nr:hypothetical protein ONZ51_g9864 [Trametes cubensis]